MRATALPSTNLRLTGDVGQEYDVNDSIVGAAPYVGANVSLNGLSSFRAWTSTRVHSASGNNMSRYRGAARLPWVNTTAYFLGNYVKEGADELSNVGNWFIGAPPTWSTGDAIYGYCNFGFINGTGTALQSPLESTSAFGGSSSGGNPTFFSPVTGQTIALRQFLYNATLEQYLIKIGGDVAGASAPAENSMSAPTFIYDSIALGGRGYQGMTSPFSSYVTTFVDLNTRSYYGGVVGADLKSLLSTSNSPYRFLIITSTGTLN
jgi:hypothetical protein